MQAATYTVCAAGAPTCNFSTVQDAINAASFGDVILLQAGETFAGFQLTYKPGPAGNPIVITTTAQAGLPMPGTRITPAYATGSSPIIARIQGSLGPTITTQNGTDACPNSATPCPAHDYILVGLEITPGLNNNAAYDHVRIGPVASTDNVPTTGGLPYNITLDRDYIHQDRLGQVRRCVTPHGVNITIENSWISDCKMRGVDSQAIEDWNGAGPLKIYNNYLDASTEIIAFGGALPTIANLIPSNIEISYNHIYRPDYYLYGPWTAKTYFGKGKFIGPTASNGFQYLAQNSGTSGASEPAWPLTAGASVTDGTIVWTAEPDNSGTRWLVKNLLESKSSDTVTVHDNVFERNPQAAQTGAAVLLTVRTGQSGSWAHVFHTTFSDNVVRHANLGMSILGRDDADPATPSTWNPNNSYGTFKYLTAANNLFYDIGAPAWGDGQGGFIGMSWAPQSAHFDHNTFDNSDSVLIEPDGDPGYDVTFTNNLMNPGYYGAVFSSQGTGCPGINYNFCNDPAAATYPSTAVQCPATAFTNNVLPGQTVAAANPCTDPGSVPAGDWNTPWTGIGFSNPSAGDYSLVPGSQYLTAGTDGKALGADTTHLPLIAGLTVTPTSDSATFTYTAPNSIACVLRVGTDPEFSALVPAVDPTKFLHADSDQFQANNTGLNRTFVVGSNTTQTGRDGVSYNLALAPNTTYWYWLACGGEGRTSTFTTAAAPPVGITPLSGTLAQGQTQQFTASAPVAWSLNPALGSISSTGLYTAPAAITAQQTVTVTATTQSSPAQTASATITLVPPVAVTPLSGTLAQGQTQQFTASAPVAWSLSAPVGSISAAGLYTAPASITARQTVTVTATTQSSPVQTVSATITLVPPVTVAPLSGTLAQGQTQQFTASAPVAWSLSAPVGSISSTGLYTAPAGISAQQTVTVTATSQSGPVQTASAVITLVPALTVTPAFSTLAHGQTQQFTASAAVAWSLSPAVGSISSTGLYTAPAAITAQQIVTVTAKSLGSPVQTASATVTLVPPRAGAAPQPKASFIAPDATTQGNWNRAYGSDGYNVVQNAAKYPPYVRVTPGGASLYTWSDPATGSQALAKVTSSQRIAATWYSAAPFTIDLNFTDDGVHKVALYCLDWDQQGRSQTVQVLSAADNTVLDSRSISNFAGGLYLGWNLSGHVKLVITPNSGPNAVVSGLFFGSGGTSLADPPARAEFVKSDAATQGNWMGVYGAAGYNVIGAAAQYPPYLTATPGGANPWTWAAGTSDPRALQLPDNPASRVAATWFNDTAVSIDVAFADGAPHQVAGYFLDWDQQGRAQRIDVLDASTFKVLDSRQIGGFSGGQYLVWNVTGEVILRITRTAGPNAVISGLFFR